MRSPTNKELDFAPPLAEYETGLEKAQMEMVRKACGKHTLVAVHALVEIAGNVKRKPEPNEELYFEPELDEDGNEISMGYNPAPRNAAARALLEHAHGRPNQRQPSAGDQPGGGGVTVIIQQISDDTKLELDVTPRTPMGADSPPEQLEAS